MPSAGWQAHASTMPSAGWQAHASTSSA